MSKLMVLDGNSVINRAYYGVTPLTTREGLYTHAVYGFLNILEKLCRQEQPDALCVAFDLHGPTFRHKRFDSYKATRHPMPEELAQQLPVIKDVLRAMRIPIYACQGWEADDVIGTVGRICSESGWECVIVTGDRDSLQLIDERVHVKLIISRMGHTTETLYTTEKFQEEYGFAPKRLIDYKSLMGDHSDNIPGVPGVGEKTALELLHRFGSLDGVYEKLDDPSIRPSLRTKLVNGKDSAYLSYWLATIVQEAPIAFRPEDALRQDIDKPALAALFRKLEFTKLMDRYGLRGAEAAAPKPQQGAAPSLPPRAACVPPETRLIAVYADADGSLGLAWENGMCVLTPMELISAEKPFAPDAQIIANDAKTALHRLAQLGLTCGGIAFDTALAAYDLDPSRASYPLENLCPAYLGEDAPTEAAACAAAVWRLREPMETALKAAGMDELYRTIELPLVTVLYRMERRGIAIDREQLERFGALLSERISDCEAIIYGYAGEPFNINSTQQLGQVLFEHLGLPVIKKTKRGYSTNVEVLEKLKGKHPIIPAIMDYRVLTKLKSTYADGLVGQIGSDGRIHTTFQNLVTETGRLSSTDPNLQNIPVRTELGAQIRKMFIPAPGCVLVDADYSQIELRVLAHIAHDEAMCAAFRAGEDIHTATASQVFGVAPEDVTPLQRRHAKAVNFGIVYGISEFSLSEDIGVSRSEAKAYIDSYLRRYCGIRDYRERVVQQARERGYTVTLYGRRRYIPELTSSNFHVRTGAERIALNTPIQGSAADLIKLAMVRVENALAQALPQAKLLLQVHDELIVECPQQDADAVAALVSREMQNVAALAVPLIADAKIGRNWYEAK